MDYVKVAIKFRCENCGTIIKPMDTEKPPKRCIVPLCLKRFPEPKIVVLHA